MKLTDNAVAVLNRRYLLRDEEGSTRETPEGLFRRVASFVASSERNFEGDAALWEEKFYALMDDLRFLPNSPTMMNAGKPNGQLAACFVLPVEDSMGSIFDTLKSAALILQSGGGTGFSFSHLRPRSDIVHSTGGNASGPVSFMKVFNTATEVIKQGGARRGANMGILRVDHPDILDFIRVKRDIGALENFNISVAVSDIFMTALRHEDEYELINPRTKRVTGTLKARTVFDEMVESAWETGDPGIIFIDVMNRSNPTPHLGPIESTNPCGEQPLLPYEACVLGSMNLARYVLFKNDTAHFDYDSLAEDIMTAVRFLDDAIDANTYPLPDIELMHKGNRKIGLGIMGWADVLIALGLPYNSRRSFRLAEQFMKFFGGRARECSEQLARERGVFPNFQGSVFDAAGMPRVRNATTTTIAPTGTLSLIAGCSSGIEPIYSLAHKRLVMDTELAEVNNSFFEKAKTMGLDLTELRMRIEKTGTLRGIREVPPRIRRIYRTALEIPYRDHIEMQAAFQKYTDNAVSKTINMPRNAKKDDVARAYLYAYERGCKGVTVFRYGARKRGVLVRFQETD
ncbi:MAG: adenosylcobalamin-dependent ribonucleoside-diphosphate reductase [Nitrospirae bacterium]|nr:adenosylcobalamin-dependent ribonucleoside-diphosphate reductase [Nitrospirota bacterium]